ncbi:cadherin repeat domain-containing protein, partial [Rubellimicrobium rubrum]
MAVHAFSAGEPVTWALVGGHDQGRFSINPTTGALTFVAAPDYEQPTDSDTNNTYVLIVEARDANGNTSQQTLTVTVLDLDEVAPQITGPSGGAGAVASAKSVNEGVTAIHIFTANETVTWSLTGGPDQSRFAIDPATGALRFLAAPDFEAPTDVGTDNRYDLVITATDSRGNVTTQAVAVTVLDVNEDTAPPAITGPSGGAGAANSAEGVDEGVVQVTTFAANEAVTWSIQGGPDAGRFALDPNTGALTFVAAPDFEAPADANRDNAYVLIIAATDTNGNVSQQT